MMKYISLLFLLLVFLQASSAQKIIKTWEIDSFQVSLIQFEQVQESFEMKVYPPKAPSYYRMLEVKKNNLPVLIGGNLQVSKDSCRLTFLELPAARNKNGKVATLYNINLCTKQLNASPVFKPVWNIEVIKNASIRPLDSTYYNPYNPHAPYTIRNFGTGEKVALHTKMLEGFILFFEHSNIIAPYNEKEFPAPHKPHFELTFMHNGVEKTLLLYWGKYIVDGYVYSGEGSYIEPSDLRFWEANLKLMGFE